MSDSLPNEKVDEEDDDTSEAEEEHTKNLKNENKQVIVILDMAQLETVMIYLFLYFVLLRANFQNI